MTLKEFCMESMGVGSNLALLKDKECGDPIFWKVWRHKNK